MMLSNANKDVTTDTDTKLAFWIPFQEINKLSGKTMNKCAKNPEIKNRTRNHADYLFTCNFYANFS